MSIEPTPTKISLESWGLVTTFENNLLNIFFKIFEGELFASTFLLQIFSTHAFIRKILSKPSDSFGCCEHYCVKLHPRQY